MKHHRARPARQRRQNESGATCKQNPMITKCQARANEPRNEELLRQLFETFSTSSHSRGDFTHSHINSCLFQAKYCLLKYLVLSPLYHLDIWKASYCTSTNVHISPLHRKGRKGTCFPSTPSPAFLELVSLLHYHC